MTPRWKLFLKSIQWRNTWGWTKRRIHLSEPMLIVVAHESSFSSASVSVVKESRMESKASPAQPNIRKHSVKCWAGKTCWRKTPSEVWWRTQHSHLQKSQDCSELLWDPYLPEAEKQQSGLDGLAHYPAAQGMARGLLKPCFSKCGSQNSLGTY